MIPTLTSERLTLRPLSEADIEPMTAFFSTERSRFVGGPLTRELTWRVLAAEIGHWSLRGYGRWSVRLTETDEVVGNIGLWNPHGWPEPEIGWDIFEPHTRKGYAAEAGRAARNYAYGTLGWTTVISMVADGNEASAGVAAKIGCKPDGRFTHERFGEMTIWRHPGPEAS